MTYQPITKQINRQKLTSSAIPPTSNPFSCFSWLKILFDCCLTEAAFKAWFFIKVSTNQQVDVLWLFDPYLIC
jgi:hypothetical protein